MYPYEVQCTHELKSYCNSHVISIDSSETTVLRLTPNSNCSHAMHNNNFKEIITEMSKCLQ